MDQNVFPRRCKDCFWSEDGSRPVGDKVLECSNPSGGIWGVPLKVDDFCSNFKPKDKR